jgi:hypothetical protein
MSEIPEQPIGHPTPELVEELVEAKRRWLEKQAQLPICEKFRILLQMQRMYLPLIEQQRPLKPWEKPWDVEP